MSDLLPEKLIDKLIKELEVAHEALSNIEKTYQAREDLAKFGAMVLAAYSDKANHKKPFFSLIEAAADMSGLKINNSIKEMVEELLK